MPDYNQISEALYCIDPNLPRDEWAKIAMAVKSHLGGEGFKLFDAWSANGDTYNRANVNDTWKSINGTGGIGIGTLFRMAKEAGWRGKPTTESPADREARKQRIAVRKAREDKERAAKQEAAATEAKRQWESASEAIQEHPYLVAKRIPTDGLRKLHDVLLAPLYAPLDDNPTRLDLVNLQSIHPDGDKRFLKGGRKKGCFTFWGKSDAGNIFIAEGVATALTVYQATGDMTVCAFDAGNLSPVAGYLRERRPDRPLVIAADADAPGRKAAVNAAKDTGATIVYPTVAEGNDWNDLAVSEGIQAVKAQIAQQLESANPEDVWEDPEPLNVSNAKHAPFPLHALPESIRKAVEELHTYGQQPVSLVASSALATVSLVCQGIADVRRDERLAGPISLAVIVSAESGERKSAADKAMSAGAREWLKEKREGERDLIKHKKGLHNAWAAEMKGFERMITALAQGIVPKRFGGSGKQPKDGSGISVKDKKDNDLASMRDEVRAEIAELEKKEPNVPRPTELFYGNTTSEGLIKELSDGYPIGALWEDEAGNIIGSAGMSDDRILGMFSTMCKLWDASPIKHTRATIDDREASGNRVTVNLMMQSAVLQRLNKAEGGLARHSGFFARMLITEPPSTIGTRKYKDPGNMFHLEAFNRRSAELLNAGLPRNEKNPKELDPPLLELSDGAHERWRKYHDEVELSMAEEGLLHDVKDFAAKSAEQAVRIAACFHIWDGRSLGDGIAEDTMAAAIDVAAWYLYETSRVISVSNTSQKLSDADQLLAWMNKRRESMFSRGMIARSGPRLLRNNRPRREAAIVELLQTKNIREVRTGNNAVSYKVNPNSRVQA